ncbi:60 kDa inner membrane protein [Rhizoctonia solani AG-3 Rhs1AP]|uniref:60 kDa inner membrane protein n=1 Tax=Rhizoctonia solani AG-3 Rhs1AP TaxID=1086054 RepID=X8JWD0_9AGAM|nr:60 kDa inner membrane protein [Rhizoctonia solani AG-3 Rhs1AP]
MFARTVLRARSHGRIYQHGIQRRQLSILEPLASGIIETGHVISSLPLPASIPPYSCAIIGITLALRMGITLPMAIWSRARAFRREHIVGPALQAWREKAKVEVGKAFARDRKPYEEYKKEMGRLQVAKIKELNKIHKCSPIPTMILPFAVHAPLFIMATASFRHAALMSHVPTNPLASESFLTLPSLAQVDPTGMLPIAVGLIMFSNIELGKLSRPSEANSTPNDVTPSNSTSKAPEDKALTEQPKMSTIISAFENGLRGVSILFIWIAMQAPGAVVIYWLTSASYTFFERLFLIKFGKRKPPQVTSSPLGLHAPIRRPTKGGA